MLTKLTSVNDLIALMNIKNAYCLNALCVIFMLQSILINLIIWLINIKKFEMPTLLFIFKELSQNS